MKTHCLLSNLFRALARNARPRLHATLPQATLALGCALALAVGTQRTQAAPNRSSPISISAANVLVSVNPDANTISVFDASAATPVKLGEVAVGREPTSVAISPGGGTAYVANAADGTVSVVNLATRAQVALVNVGAEPMELALSPNGTRLYVANSASGSLMVINTATVAPTVVATVDLSAFGTAPRAIAVTDDGDADDTDETIFVTLFYAQLRPGKTFIEEGQDDQREGRVVAISAATSTVLGAPAALGPIANTGFNSNGQLAPGSGLTPAAAPTNPQSFTTPTAAFPNQLAGLAIRPNDPRAYVISTAASPNGPVRFNHNVHGLISVFNTGTRAEITAGQTGAGVRQTAPLNMNQGVNLATLPAPRLFHSNPTAIAWRPDGSDAWITIQQADVLLRMTVDANGIPTISAPLVAGPSQIARVDLQGGAIPGKAPRGVVINSAGTRAYVFNYVSRSISVVDISSPTAPTIAASVQATALPAANTPEATAQLGAEMFFSGRGPNDGLAQEAWGSCASCHPHGRADNVTWMFDGGPRQTIALDGTFGPTHQKALQRILNWSGVRDEVHDFELNSRGVSGGRGLIEDDRLFLAFGGASGATPTDTNLVEQFHQVTGAIGTVNDLAGEAIPALPSERRDFAIATLEDGRVFIIGGRSGAGQGALVTGADTVLEFNARSNSFRTRSATGFTPRHSFGAAAVRTSGGLRIYAIGGYAGTSVTASPVGTVEEYNPATDTWRTVATLPTAVAQFGITVAGGINTAEPLQLIHVVSGNVGSESAPSVANPNPVQRFQADPAGAGTWFAFNPVGLTLRRNHGAAAVLRGVSSRVFVIGGQDAADTVLSTVEEYSAQAVTLVATPHTALPAPRARFGIAGTLSTQQIYLIGGVDGAGADQATVFEYTVANNGPVAGPPGTPSGTWVTRGNLSAARRGLHITTPPGVVNFLPFDNTGRSVAQDALAEFVRLRLRPAKAPVPATDPNALAGRTLFGTTGLVVPGFSCASCHSGPTWTRSIVDYTAPPSPEIGLGLGNQRVIGAELRHTATQLNSQGPLSPPQAPGVLLNVGTFTQNSPGGRVNEIRVNPADISQPALPLGANGFNIPSLLSLHETAPYFYSGLAQTLNEVLDGSKDGNGGIQHHFVPNPSQRAQLVAFLGSIDNTTTIFPGAPGETIIACSSNVVAECTGGLTPVTFTVTAANANGPVPVTCVPPSGTGFPLGTSNVVCTADGAISPCQFTVTVQDTTPPTVTCNSNRVVDVPSPAGAVVTYFTDAFDACSLASLQCEPGSGSSFPIGVTPVTCTAVDTAGNTNACTFTVTVAFCAASITVTSTNDSGPGTLRQAIADICPGGTIDFHPNLNGRTILLTSGELVINKSMSIRGPGATNLIVARSTNEGTALFRLFTVNAGVQGFLGGVTLSNGSVVGAGGAIWNAGQLTVSECLISGNLAQGGNGVGRLDNPGGEGGRTNGFGGGIYNSGWLRLTNSILEANTAQGGRGGSSVSFGSGGGGGGLGGGGGVFNDQGTVEVWATSLAGNRAVGGDGNFGGPGSGGPGGGGGGTGGQGGNAGSPGGSAQSGAFGGGGGGGGSRVSSGGGGNGGGGGFGAGGGGGGSGNPGGVGGIAGLAGGNGGFSGSTGGGAGGGGAGLGGGLFSRSGAVSIAGCTFSDNRAAGGAGSSTPSGGRGRGGDGGSGFGAAIFNFAGTFTVENCTLANTNRALAGAAGGIYEGSTLASPGNPGSATGHALYNLDGSMELRQLTIASNGVCSDSAAACDASTTMASSPAIVNRSIGGPALLSIANSIVFGNVGGDIANQDAMSGGSNLVQFAAGVPPGIISVTADPKLGPLANRGGPTLTHALLPGSPAINLGDNTLAAGLLFDQRGSGFSRVFGGAVDLGAFEAQDTGPACVLNWKFDEASGLEALDSSGNTNLGRLLNGPIRTNGVLGRALRFDGSNDRVQATNTSSLNVTGAFTIACWVRPESVSENRYFLIKGNDEDERFAYALRSASAKVEYRWVNPAGNQSAFRTTTNVLAIGRWTHVAVAHTPGSAPTIFINGVAVPSSLRSDGGSATHLIGTSPNPFCVGMSADGVDRFKGTIDEVFVCLTKLTAGQIRNLTNGLPPGPPPPPPAVGIATASPLAGGAVGAAYSAMLMATGGTPGFTWSLVSGTLPGGLTLNTNTGVISGTPTAAGTNSFRVRVQDTAAQASEKDFTLGIANRPPCLVHWKFDEIGGTTALDSSGNGINGTLLNGPLRTNGQVNGALRFDGSNDRVTGGNPSSLNYTGALTVAAWVRPESVSGTRLVVIKGEIDGENYAWALGQSDGKLQYRWVNTSDDDSIHQSAPVVLASGRWTHIAATHTPGSTPRLYTNGVLVAGSITTGSGTANIGAASKAFTVGSDAGGNKRFLGIIDEVFVCRGALESGALSNLMAGLPPDFVPLAPSPLPDSSRDSTVLPLSCTLRVLDGIVTVSWSSIPGLIYRVQFKESLDETEWQDLVGDVYTPGAEAGVDDALEGAAQRFYRVVLQP